MDSTKTLKGNVTPSFLKQVFRHAGLRDREMILVHVQPRHIEIMGSGEAEPVTLSDEERARRLRIVRQLYGIWSEDDEIAFRQTRKELWSQWQPHHFA